LIAQPHIGQAESIKRVVRQSDFDRFAALSGDVNPIHVDAEFARRSKFGRTVAHGMFLYSVVCSVLGTGLPGPGTVQVEQELMFPSATYAGEEVTVTVQVTESRAAEGLVELTTVVTRPDGNMGLQGRTLVRLPGTALPAPVAIRPPDRPSDQPGNSSFKGLRVGMRAGTWRAFTAQDLAEYASLSGDTNPIFTDAGYARQRGLQEPIIPGGLLGGLFSYLLGMRLPGEGTNYLKQRLEFPALAYQSEELTAAVEIVRIRPEKQLINLRTECTNERGALVCQGQALVLVSDLKGKE
jgi:acyl dehydratase